MLTITQLEIFIWIDFVPPLIRL